MMRRFSELASRSCSIAQGVDARAPRGLGNRQVGFEHLPLFVGEVGLVCSSHDARYPTEPRPQNPFSDGF